MSSWLRRWTRGPPPEVAQLILPSGSMKPRWPRQRANCARLYRNGHIRSRFRPRTLALDGAHLLFSSLNWFSRRKREVGTDVHNPLTHLCKWWVRNVPQAESCSRGPRQEWCIVGNCLWTAVQSPGQDRKYLSIHPSMYIYPACHCTWPVSIEKGSFPCSHWSLICYIRQKSSFSRVALSFLDRPAGGNRQPIIPLMDRPHGQRGQLQSSRSNPVGLSRDCWSSRNHVTGSATNVCFVNTLYFSIFVHLGSCQFWSLYL